MAGQSDIQATTTADLAHLNWRLGLAYAEAVRATIDSTRIRPNLIGCHGQTLYHQGVPAPYAGRRFACTWQLGEPALIAAATGLPVVSNFRPADMAAGGQGAPLVPLLDYVLFAHPTRARVLQNIGGIANLTFIPAAATQEKVIAFDTGPGNMIIDALMQQLFAKPYDRNGRIAARGKILEPVLPPSSKKNSSAQSPPKSAGREQFGADYAKKIPPRLPQTRQRHLAFRPADAIATATALTVETIADAVRCWVLPLTHNSPIDFIVSGGGARNATLLAQLRDRLASLTLQPYHHRASGPPRRSQRSRRLRPPRLANLAPPPRQHPLRHRGHPPRHPRPNHLCLAWDVILSATREGPRVSDLLFSIPCSLLPIP